MSLTIAVRPEAAEDLTATRAWYEERVAGLGERFLTAVDDFFERIRAFPEIYAVVMAGVRGGKIKRFPYIVYYRVLTDKIEILAVLHGSRDPSVWRSRIRKA